MKVLHGSDSGKENLTPVEDTNQVAMCSNPPSNAEPSEVRAVEGSAPSGQPPQISDSVAHNSEKCVPGNNEEIITDHGDKPTEINNENIDETETEDKIEDNDFKDKMKKFNAKEMNKEEIMEFVEECVKWMETQTDWAQQKVKSRLRMIDRSYHVYSKYRKSIAQKIVDIGFPELSMKMAQFFNVKGEITSDDIWLPTYYMYHLTWNFSDTSSVFAIALAEKGLLKFLLAIANHKPYFDDLSNKRITTLLKASVSVLHNMSKHPEIKYLFTENNAVQILKPYMNVENKFLQAVSCMTIARVIAEEDNHILNEIGCIKFIAICLKKALANEKTRRHRGFSVVELVDGMVHLAVKDDNKQKVVEAGTLSSLVIMMQGCKIDEQIIAAKCVWTLSFDTNVRERIKSEEGCITALQTLCSSENDTVRKMAKGAIWQIEGHGEKDIESEEESTKKSKRKKHIFISYNHTHQEVVKKIAEQLKHDNFKIWLDIEQMGGDMIEAMAEAIENAEAMIMCMSEKYKLSPDCQSEARYAYRRRIPIVPLMVQRFYKPDGWLGFLLSAKLYINFDGKFTFDVAYKKLLKELEIVQTDVAGDNVDGLIEATTIQNVGAAPATKNLKSNIAGWTRDQVAEWLDKQSLTQFKGEFSDYDGRYLLGLKKIKEQAPEFFHSMLQKQIFHKMIELVKFTTALDDL